MITLYGFGPKFDLPDASPFVMKTEVQLKMAGIAYRLERGSPRDAPKGKLPFIKDGNARIGDSTLIREHIERAHGIDLEAGRTAAERAAGWAIERLLEDHLYWAMLHLRWADDANFTKGPSQFFPGVAPALRDERRAALLDRIAAHGLGRHTPHEIAEFGDRSLAALSTLLDDRPYLFGNEPSAVDATAFAMFTSVATPFFESPLTRRARGYANLMAQSARMMSRYYPDFAAGPEAFEAAVASRR
jgi:glutathione S-transferase